MEKRAPDLQPEPVEPVDVEASRQIASKSPLRGLMVAGGGILLGCLLVMVLMYL